MSAVRRSGGMEDAGPAEQVATNRWAPRTVTSGTKREVRRAGAG